MTPMITLPDGVATQATARKFIRQNRCCVIIYPAHRQPAIHCDMCGRYPAAERDFDLHLG